MITLGSGLVWTHLSQANNKHDNSGNDCPQHSSSSSSSLSLQSYTIAIIIVIKINAYLSSFGVLWFQTKFITKDYTVHAEPKSAESHWAGEEAAQIYPSDHRNEYPEEDNMHISFFK